MYGIYLYTIYNIMYVFECFVLPLLGEGGLGVPQWQYDWGRFALILAGGFGGFDGVKVEIRWGVCWYFVLQ